MWPLPQRFILQPREACKEHNVMHFSKIQYKDTHVAHVYTCSALFHPPETLRVVLFLHFLPVFSPSGCAVRWALSAKDSL